MQDKYIKIILKEAYKAYKYEEIPVGALIVYNDKIISKAYNNRQKKNNILGHAEIESILKAEKKLKDWRLDNCIMYVTMAPCKMCEVIINESRISKVYYLIKNNKNLSNNYSELSGYLNEKKQYQELLNPAWESSRNNRRQRKPRHLRGRTGSGPCRPGRSLRCPLRSS